MATLKPFRALRPVPAKAKDVCCPPYDVINTEEARAMAAGNPVSFLRVTRPEIEMAADQDPYAPEVYVHGGRNLRKFIADGVLFQDKKPCYYLYRLQMGGHAQTGLVAVASCAEYDADLIKKHELTRPDKEDDRMRHINILGAQTGPVFLTYRARPEIDALVAKETNREPDVDFTADDGIRHTAWVVSSPETIEWIGEAFKGVDLLYVADGHHRSAAAARVAKERAAANEKHSGEEPYNFFLTVTFPDNQMQIMGYNRVVKDMHGMSKEEFLERLAPLGQILDAPEDHRPMRHGECTMYLDGEWKLLRFIPDPRTPRDVVACLDVTFLQDNILEPMFGIENPRTDKRIAFVGGIRGTRELEKMVQGGDHAVAFCLYPTTVDELMAVADMNCLMPPKSTWFEPKLRDAMMVHVL